MPDKKRRADRRTQQAREVEASQQQLRDNIAETARLVEASDEMLRRHRKECDDDSAEAAAPGRLPRKVRPRSS